GRDDPHDGQDEEGDEEHVQQRRQQRVQHRPPQEETTKAERWTMNGKAGPTGRLFIVHRSSFIVSSQSSGLTSMFLYSTLLPGSWPWRANVPLPSTRPGMPCGGL